MFENIGSKIKGLAQTVCWVGIIIFCVAGFSFIIIGTETNDGGGIAVIGILVAIVGSFLSWISSFTLYGFGELIDKACDIKQLLSSTNTTYKHDPGDQPTENVTYEHEAFIKQILSTPTSDLLLILEDQQALYTEAEIRIIKDVLSKRPNT